MLVHTSTSTSTLSRSEIFVAREIISILLMKFAVGFVSSWIRCRTGEGALRTKQETVGAPARRIPDKTLEPEESFYTGEFHVKRALMIL